MQGQYRHARAVQTCHSSTDMPGQYRHVSAVQTCEGRTDIQGQYRHVKGRRLAKGTPHARERQRKTDLYDRENRRARATETCEGENT